MKISVLPCPGCKTPSSVDALSTVRTDVVPTQMTRLPSRFAALMMSALCCVTS